MDSMQQSAVESCLIIGNSIARRRQMQMFIRQVCYASAARCSCEEADLHEIRLINVLQRNGFFPDRGRERFKPDRAAAILLYDRLQHSAINHVKAEMIDLKTG